VVLDIEGGGRAASRTRRVICEIIARVMPARTARALLLDLDDTLIPDDEAMDASLAAAGRQVLPSVAGEVLAAGVRAAAREVWRASPLWAAGQRLGVASSELLWAACEGGDTTIQAIREWLPTFRERVWTLALERLAQPVRAWPGLHEVLVRERRDRCRCYPGTAEMLARLGAGQRLAIVTNGPPDLQRTKIQLAGLESAVDSIVISGEVGFGKPDARIFEVALTSVDAGPTRAVMVGDNPVRDVAGAQAVGMRAIWISHGRAVPSDLQPDGCVSSMTDLEHELARVWRRGESPALAPGESR
jgi:HAD superfamily hydrolase (TIGR01549 family)